MKINTERERGCESRTQSPTCYRHEGALSVHVVDVHLRMIIVSRSHHSRQECRRYGIAIPVRPVRGYKGW